MYPINSLMILYAIIYIMIKKQLENKRHDSADRRNDQ